MARYTSIEIVPREIFVIGHEAAMVWTINGVTEAGAVSFGGVDVFRFDDAGLISSVRAFWERDARSTVSSSAFAMRNLPAGDVRRFREHASP